MRASLLRRRIARALLLLALCLSASAADPWERLSAAVGKPAAESEKDLEALVLENPGFHAAHYDLGTLQLERDPAKAASHLETAAAAPNRQLAADSYHNLAIARWRQGRLDEALTCAVRAAELNPELIPFRDQMRTSVLVAKDQARLKAEEEAKKLRLPTSALPPACAGLPYRATVRAAGGAGGYTYTIAGDTRLPHGMAFDADGTLHGMPEAAGTHELTIEVKDAAAATATGKFAFIITPPPEILTTQLPEAIAGLPYRATLRASGLAQARWSAVDLPAGLAIAGAADGSAVISGETSAIGTHGVEVTAEEGQRRAHRRFELVVSDSFAPDVLELPPATAWAPYHHRCGVRGPEQEYHWSLVGEAAGFTLADDGQLSGEPASAGDLGLTVDLTAADGRTRRSTLVLPVNPPPLIDEHEPITVEQGKPVEHRLAASGGTPPLQWTLAEGMLPKGLRLDPDGAIRGATGEVGEATVTASVADRWKATTKQELKLTVTPSDDPPPKDAKDEKKEQKQQEGGQTKDDQQKKDDPGQKDDGTDQAGDSKAGDGSDPKDDQQKKGKDPQDDHKQAGQQPSAGTDDGSKDGGKQEQPAPAGQSLDQAAGEHWLDQLPKEDRAALRGQLLRRAGRPRQKGNPW